MTLIGAQDTWGLWAVLITAGAAGLWAERTRWGRRLSSAVIAIGATFLLSNTGVIPAEAPAYGVVWSYLVPLAIPLLLFKADLRRILREAGPTLLAFLAGGVGTVIGTVVAYRLVPLGPEGWKLAGIFCATYVGGSLNYMAAAEALELRTGDLLTAGIAADNLVMTLYFLLLFALPAMSPLARWCGGGTRATQAEGSRSATAERQAITPEGMAASLAAAAILCASGYGLASLVGVPSAGILVVTALTVTTATVAPSFLGRFGGAQELGVLLMQIFFATIGASANISVVLRVGPRLFLFAALILAVHLLFLLLAARVLRVRLDEIVIASNANMGGPTTAAAMATARRWHHLVIPAILCGTLGYAVATFVGVAVGHWLR